MLYIIVFLLISVQVIEHVELNMTIETSFRGGLAINLRAPSGKIFLIALCFALLISVQGVVSRLQEFHRDHHPNISNWRYQSIFHWGESVLGSWKISVVSQKVGNTPSGTCCVVCKCVADKCVNQFGEAFICWYGVI